MHPASIPAPVLVVDDDAICRLFCHKVLTAAGREVLLASTAEDAIGLASSRHPAIIVLDMHLGDVPGRALSTMIHQSWPRQLALPVFIAMTGDDSVLPGSLALGAEFSYALNKPFTAGKLRELVDDILFEHEIAGSPQCSFSGTVSSGLEQALRTEWESGLEEIDRLLSDSRWNEANDVLHRLRGAAALAGKVELAEGAKQLMQAIAREPGGANLAEVYLDFLWQGAEFIRTVSPVSAGLRPRESIAPFP